MPLSVEISEAKARLSEFVARAEAGEEIVIARGGQPVARLAPFDLTRRARVEQAIEAVRALRARAKPVTVEEILAWKREGRRE
jgi:prevent-host-death family protein